MSDKSNYQVETYGLVCLLTISEDIGECRSVNIIKNRGYSAA